MPPFEVEHKGEIFEVNAPSIDIANEAVSKMFAEKSMMETLEGSKQAVEERIAARGESPTLRDQMETVGKSKGFIPKTVETLKLIAIPQVRLESAVANTLIDIQNGDFSNLGKRFGEGIKGERLAELGDIMRNVDAPEGMAATVGFMAAMVSPLTLLNKASKALKGISKADDALLKTAGNSIVKGSDDAVKIVGNNVDNAYKAKTVINGVETSVNDIVGSGDDLIQAFGDMPDNVITAIEKEIGKNIDDIALNPSIKDVRKIKGVLGKLKANAFGKGDRGAIETLVDDKINKSYGNMKGWLQKTLTDNGLTKEADNLLKADDLFVEIDGSSKLLKSKIINRKLRKATETHKIAKGLKEDGSSIREALTTLKDVDKKVRKDVGFAVNLLEDYNKSQAFKHAVVGTGRVIGIGSIGGFAGSKASEISRNIGN